jgi:hypothetical protein
MSSLLAAKAIRLHLVGILERIVSSLVIVTGETVAERAVE